MIVNHNSIGNNNAIISRNPNQNFIIERKRKIDDVGQLSQIEMSPSKRGFCIAKDTLELTERRNCKINGNVSFGTLRDTCTKFSEIASQMDNSIQNTVYTLVEELTQLLEDGDFGADRHRGTLIEPVAACLHSLTCNTSTIIQPGFPVVRSSVPREGPNPTLRLGHKNSVASSQANKCGFCLTVNVHPGNQSHCPKRKEWGLRFSVKTECVEIGVKISSIIAGTGRFPDLSNLEHLRKVKKLKSPPKNARRIQVKGYRKELVNAYLFCTCIDRFGNALSQKEGSKTASYENVFIENVSLMTSLSKFDFVFFAPLDLDTIDGGIKKDNEKAEIYQESKEEGESLVTATEKKKPLRRVINDTLPKPWNEYLHPDSGTSFYHNPETNTSQWDKPRAT